MARLRFLVGAAFAATLGVLATVACQEPPVPDDTLPTSDAPTTKKSSTTSSGDDDDDTATATKPESDPPLPDGGKPPGRVYAHTADTLYLFDPLIMQLTVVAPFSGLDAGDRMLDIALDKDSVMYGTTDEGFVKIDPVSASCTYVKKDGNFEYPNALAFVPTGTVDPTKEALVGYKQLDGANGATSYVRIDLTTGTITTIGDLNGGATSGTMWQSSGDIISMIRNGNRAFVTVKPVVDPDAGTGDDDDGLGDDDTTTATDSLAEIDPKTGAIKNIVGAIGQSNLYGLGQWAGTAYGFNDQGNVIQIDLTTGAGTTIMSLVDDAGVPGSWFGAGVTTDAPTKP